MKAATNLVTSLGHKAFEVKEISSKAKPSILTTPQKTLSSAPEECLGLILGTADITQIQKFIKKPSLDELRTSHQKDKINGKINNSRHALLHQPHSNKLNQSNLTNDHHITPQSNTAKQQFPIATQKPNIRTFSTQVASPNTKAPIISNQLFPDNTINTPAPNHHLQCGTNNINPSNPFTVTIVALNPFISNSTHTNPFTRSNIPSNPFTVTTVAPNPFISNSTHTNPFTRSNIPSNPFTSNTSSPNPFTGRNATNPFTSNPTTPNPFIHHETSNQAAPNLCPSPTVKTNKAQTSSTQTTLTLCGKPKQQTNSAITQKIPHSTAQLQTKDIMNISYTELGNKLTKYFLDCDPTTKNQRLAQIQTKKIQDLANHDIVFKELFGFTFEEFLLIINGHNQDKTLQFHVRQDTSERASALSNEPNIFFTPKEQIHDNSRIYIEQLYNTDSVNILFTVQGYKTYPSNNLMESVVEDSDIVGVNHNTITFSFKHTENNKRISSIIIETNASYPGTKQKHINNAEKLIEKITEPHRKEHNYLLQIINLRFLNNLNDRELYESNYETIDQVAQQKNIKHHGLWLNSYEKQTDKLPKNKNTDKQAISLAQFIEVQLLKSIKDENRDRYLKNPELDAQHMIFIGETLSDSLRKEDFKKMGASIKIFGLLIIFISCLHKDKQPILLAGCKSAKDRTGVFLFCGLLISAIFFHRAYNKKNEGKRTNELLSFLDSKGQFTNLSTEEFTLIKGMLNNPILYNILSKLGIGEYNNKNMNILKRLLINYPNLQEVVILEDLINSKI